MLAVEHMHGCKANHLCTEFVHEVFNGETVWKGGVEIFGLAGHPKAKRCYAWGERKDANSLSRLWGRDVEANLAGGFQAEFQKLPESGIIRSLFFQNKIGNVAIKLDGARLSIEGAPIQKITWQTGSKGNIQIRLEAELVKAVLTDNYLTNAVDTLEQAFNIFVLGKAPNESI